MVCAHCPVRARCFEDANGRPDADGILGGAVFVNGSAHTVEQWLNVWRLTNSPRTYTAI
jgi:Transcription factor WhiB